MPLRMLEVGTSAGLLLRWDHYRNLGWFPDMFEEGTPPDGEVTIAERSGCDLFPIDATSPKNELRLKSLVWADLVQHVRMVEDAVEGLPPLGFLPARGRRRCGPPSPTPASPKFLGNPELG